MYILGFKIIIGLLLSLHNIVGLQNEKCRSGGRKCQITFKNIVLTQNESTWLEKKKLTICTANKSLYFLKVETHHRKLLPTPNHF